MARQTRRENALWAKMRDMNLGKYKEHVKEGELTDLATAEFMQIADRETILGIGGLWVPHKGMSER